MYTIPQDGIVALALGETIMQLFIFGEKLMAISMKLLRLCPPILMYVGNIQSSYVGDILAQLCEHHL